MAEIATLCAVERPVTLVGLIDPDFKDSWYAGLRVAKTPAELTSLDAILIAGLQDPQEAFEQLSGFIANEPLMTPPLLRVLRETTKP